MPLETKEIEENNNVLVLLKLSFKSYQITLFWVNLYKYNELVFCLCLSYESREINLTKARFQEECLSRGMPVMLQNKWSNS